MNQDKINYFKLQNKIDQRDAIQRLADKNTKELSEMDLFRNLSFNIKESDLADDSLKVIQQDLCENLAELLLEMSIPSTKIKKINRILKLRKTPKLDD